MLVPKPTGTGLVPWSGLGGALTEDEGAQLPKDRYVCMCISPKIAPVYLKYLLRALRALVFLRSTSAKHTGPFGAQRFSNEPVPPPARGPYRGVLYVTK